MRVFIGRFGIQRDRLYVVITGIVLFVIIATTQLSRIMDVKYQINSYLLIT